MTDPVKKEKPPCQYPALILSGGRSRRMGQNKALLPLGSDTVLERVQKAFSELSTTSVLVIGRDATEPVGSGFDRIVRDENQDYGPLEGMRVGFQFLSGHDMVLVGTCDAPLVVTDVYRLLIDRLTKSPDCQAALPRIDGQQYPLTAVYRRSVLDEITRMVDRQQLRVRDLLDRINIVELTDAEIRTVDPDLQTIRNLNTREEYQRMLRELE